MAEYAVLWLAAPAARTRRRGSTAALGGARVEPAAVRLTRERFDEVQAAEAHASPEMVIARKMRTSLVRPLGLSDASGVDDWALAATGADLSPYDGRGCRVAVLDTGIEAGHPAFVGLAIDQEDFTGSGIGDREGHGTHCAGIAFGRDVGGRRIGVAPGVERALIGKVLDDTGSGDSVGIYEGLAWAFRQGAQVISLSAGIDFPGQVEDKVADGWPVDLATSDALVDYSENLQLFQALRHMVATTMLGTEPLIIAAAGNESRRNEGADFVVAPSLPALALHLSVGAVGRDGANYRVADFSNAPPTLVAPGVDIVSAALGGGLVAESGTSMACPHVAGLAACWASKLRAEGAPVDAGSLRSALIASSQRGRISDYAVAGKSTYGHGLATAPA